MKVPSVQTVMIPIPIPIPIPYRVCDTGMCVCMYVFASSHFGNAPRTWGIRRSLILALVILQFNFHQTVFFTLVAKAVDNLHSS